MAMLDVHKGEARVLCPYRSPDEVLYDVLDFRIRQARRIRLNPELTVEHRMVVENTRFDAVLAIGTREAARVRQLQTN